MHVSDACGRAEHFYARTHAHLPQQREGKGRKGEACNGKGDNRGRKGIIRGIIRGNSKPHHSPPTILTDEQVTSCTCDFVISIKIYREK
jgi:hypothetical protein